MADQNKVNNVFNYLISLNQEKNKNKSIYFQKGSVLRLGEFYGSFKGNDKTLVGAFGNTSFFMGDEHLISEYLVNNEKYKDVMETIKQYV